MPKIEKTPHSKNRKLEWLISNKWKKHVIERRAWEHKSKGIIITEEVYRWGSYVIETEINVPPVFRFTYYPDNVNKIKGLNMKATGYKSSLIELIDGCDMQIAWFNGVSEKEKDDLLEALEIDSFDAWGKLGWVEKGEAEVWFIGDIDVQPFKIHK